MWSRNCFDNSVIAIQGCVIYAYQFSAYYALFVCCRICGIWCSCSLFPSCSIVRGWDYSSGLEHLCRREQLVLCWLEGLWFCLCQLVRADASLLIELTMLFRSPGFLPFGGWSEAFCKYFFTFLLKKETRLDVLMWHKLGYMFFCINSDAVLRQYIKTFCEE